MAAEKVACWAARKVELLVDWLVACSAATWVALTVVKRAPQKADGKVWPTAEWSVEQTAAMMVAVTAAVMAVH